MFILEKLANIEVGRWPKVTFVKDMFWKAERCLKFNLCQFWQKIMMTTWHCIIMPPVTMDILTPLWMWKKGDVLVVGLTEMGGADAQSQLDLFNDRDWWNWGQPKKKGFPTKVITSIKNSMSDRCATSKTLMIFFMKYRMELLPQLLKIGTSFPKRTSSHWEMSKWIFLWSTLFGGTSRSSATLSWTLGKYFA